MRRWVLSKKDRKKLLETLAHYYNKLRVEKNARIEVVVEDSDKLYLFDGIPAFIESKETGERPVPHILFLLRRGYGWLPTIIVDEGAVRPISRGADLMRPGIVEIKGEFNKGDVIVITEPSRGLPLAVHEALYSNREVIEMEKGKVSRRLHYVGDRFWRLSEQL